VRVVITGATGLRAVGVRFGRGSGGHHPSSQGDNRRLTVSLVSSSNAHERNDIS
jgi:hypothetical protein